MILVQNKKARFEYDIEKTYQAGLVLTGPEVKSLRLKHASLTGSYVQIQSGEAVLLNAQINPYAYANNNDYDPRRTRKLLLSKKEILQLDELHKNGKRALVALAIELKGNLIKIKIGVGRGLKKYDKREKIKKRDQERQIQRQMKSVRH